MPIPDIPNPKSRALQDLLEIKAGLTEQEAILMEFSIWMLIQHEENVSDTIQQLLKNDDRLLTVLPQLTDFINQCPRWKLCGCCSEDMLRKR